MSFNTTKIQTNLLKGQIILLAQFSRFWHCDSQTMKHTDLSRSVAAAVLMMFHLVFLSGCQNSTGGNNAFPVNVNANRSSVSDTNKSSTPEENTEEGLGTLHPGEHPGDEKSDTKPAAFTDPQKAKLEAALTIAKASIADPLFRKILNDQASAGVFRWDEGRLDTLREGQQRGDLEGYFLDQFDSRGLPTMKNFEGRTGYSSVATTGSAVPCKDTVYFNVANLDQPKRTSEWVADTIVHERVHGFCFEHKDNRSREQYNRCDFSYQAGHVAAVIALYKANNSKPIKKPLELMCESLVKRLRDENLIEK